jgi:hypothetical protein
MPFRTVATKSKPTGIDKDGVKINLTSTQIRAKIIGTNNS